MRHFLATLALVCTTFSAEILHTIDGDTFRANLTSDWVDIGVDTQVRYRLTRARVRVLGVQAPELHGPTSVAGNAARAFAAAWLTRPLPEPAPVVVRTCAADSFGRWLGTVTRGPHNLAEDLLAAGHAVPYKPK